jgi:hypothetical protein
MRFFLPFSLLLIFSYHPLVYSDNSVVTLIEPYDQGHALTDHDMHGGYSAPASIDLSSGFNAFVEGSCIYWKAFENGLDLGITTGPYEDFDIKTDYHLGFKAKAGFHTTGDYWNYAFSYLFLHTQGNVKPLHGNIGSATPSTQFWYTDDGIFRLTDSLKARWTLHVDMMDATLSRPFYLGCKVTMEPYTGLRGGWIFQEYKVPAFISSINQHIKNDTTSHSYLIGARGGLLTNWIIFNYARIFGNLSASLLFQQFKVRNFQETVFRGSVIANAEMKKKFKDVTPNIDACLGAGLGGYFFQKRLHLDLTVSYDFSVYFNQNALSYIKNLVRELPSTGFENLTMHGVTGSLRIDF